MVDLPSGALVAALLIFGAVALGTVSIVLAWEGLRARGKRKGVTEQLEKLLSESRNDAASGAGSLFRRETDRESGLLARIVARLPHLRDVELLIEQAALDWSGQTYLLLTGGFGLGAGVGMLVATRSPLFALLGAIAGASAPYFYVRKKRTKRMRGFEEQLPEAIDLLGRALRAGHPLSAGFKMVGEEAPEPTAGEFRRVFEEQRFGLSLQDALLGMADRIPLVDVRIFVTAVLIQRDVGGNLAEILDKLSEVIRQRFSIMRQLRTFTAQGRMSGYILGGLPIFLGLVLLLINRENMLTFLTHPLGKLMLTVAVVMQTVGYLWIQKIIKIEV